MNGRPDAQHDTPRLCHGCAGLANVAAPTDGCFEAKLEAYMEQLSHFWLVCGMCCRATCATWRSWTKSSLRKSEEFALVLASLSILAEQDATAAVGPRQGLTTSGPDPPL